MKKLKKLLLVAVFIVLLLIVLKFILKKFVFKNDYLDIIVDNNIKIGVDPYLILSIIKVESNFNSDAKSNKDAKGLMQIMDTTTEDVMHLIDLEKINLYNIEDNIIVGTAYFGSLVKRYSGNYFLAICAYNAGIGNVDKWLKDGIIDYKLTIYNISTPFKETNNYLKKVILSYNMYKILY